MFYLISAKYETLSHQVTTGTSIINKSEYMYMYMYYFIFHGYNFRGWTEFAKIIICETFPFSKVRSGKQHDLQNYFFVNFRMKSRKFIPLKYNPYTVMVIASKNILRAIYRGLTVCEHTNSSPVYYQFVIFVE